MAITAKKTTTTITISGASQSSVTASIMGRIDQLILESSVANQQVDVTLNNHTGLQIYKKEGMIINTVVNDERPNILPMGPVTIVLSNPLNVEGTVTVTFIEKERES